MRKIDYCMISLLATAAVLCYIGLPIAAYFFIISSTIGFVDGKRNKCKAAQIINAIFIMLNVATIVRSVVENGKLFW